MRGWWRRQSLRVRLTAWFAAVLAVILLGLIPVVYTLIERRLTAETDRQLRVDWKLIEAHLEPDGAGGIRWKQASPATPASPGYADTWFDVWSGEMLLLSHWPPRVVRVANQREALDGPNARFRDLDLVGAGSARTLEQATRIEGVPVTLRVFRDQSGLRRTLREILMGQALGALLAAMLAAVGGWFMAGRTLRPVNAMVEQARRIGSDSLGERLPNPNPHDELGRLATVFNDTLQRLEDSFASLKRFTADASHELRTPLTALRAVGEVALRDVHEPRALRETIGSMLEEAQRLNDLVDALLHLARIENERASLRFEPVMAGELMDEACEQLEVLAEEKQQSIRREVWPGLRVHADRLLLRQALLNILHNAIRYSPVGSTIRLRGFLRNREAVLEIADEGPGIAPEHWEKIFERFYRVDRARSRLEGGAGLGLAIARLSVEQHGGRIELESEPGQGSRFSVVLPERCA